MIIFKKNLKSVILAQKLYIWCNTVERFFLHYLSKTAWILVENIEQLKILYKYILLTLSDYANEVRAN